MTHKKVKTNLFFVCAPSNMLNKNLCEITECEWHSPFNASNEKDEVAIDFGAVDKLVNVVGVHCLSSL